MYKIKRRHIVEQLEIEDGEKKLVLDVDINVDDILNEYTRLNRNIGKLRQKAQGEELTDEILEEYGKMIVAYFVLFFGEEQTEKLVKFYGGRYNEMLSDVTPFLKDAVIPKIIKAQEDITKKYTALAKR